MQNPLGPGRRRPGRPRAAWLRARHPPPRCAWPGLWLLAPDGKPGRCGPHRNASQAPGPLACPNSNR
eukprot:7408234-Lingulodinium_polyedra.AAC.1